MRCGFTLVECMLASAIFGLLTLVLFEGVIVSTRIAHENADMLAAEAIAWDVAWTRFNQPYSTLVAGTWEHSLTDGQVQQLGMDGYADPVALVTVGNADEAGFSRSGQEMRKITVDVEWGPAERRRSLSGYDRCPQVFRGNLPRSPEEEE